LQKHLELSMNTSAANLKTIAILLAILVHFSAANMALGQARAKARVNQLRTTRPPPVAVVPAVAAPSS
jgi:high-affinity K+ transport system ATPase subunit B